MKERHVITRFIQNGRKNSLYTYDGNILSSVCDLVSAFELSDSSRLGISSTSELVRRSSSQLSTRSSSALSREPNPAKFEWTTESEGSHSRRAVKYGHESRGIRNQGPLCWQQEFNGQSSSEAGSSSLEKRGRRNPRSCEIDASQRG
jgi:hypothetical protein